MLMQRWFSFKITTAGVRDGKLFASMMKLSASMMKLSANMMSERRQR